MCREGLRLSSTHFCTSINLDQDFEVWKHCVDRLSSGGRQGACRGNYHPHTGQVITSRSLENVVCKLNWFNVAEYHTTDKMAGKWLRFVMTLSGLWSLMACRALSPETNLYHNIWNTIFKPENSVLFMNIRENFLMRASMGLRNPPRWNMVLSWRFFFLVVRNRLNIWHHCPTIKPSYLGGTVLLLWGLIMARRSFCVCKTPFGFP